MPFLSLVLLLWQHYFKILVQITRGQSCTVHSLYLESVLWKRYISVNSPKNPVYSRVKIHGTRRIKIEMHGKFEKDSTGSRNKGSVGRDQGEREETADGIAMNWPSLLSQIING